MMIFFSLYFPILLSLSLSFLLHAFKKHIHSFFGLISTFNSTTTNYKPQKKCHHPISSTAIANILPPPPLRPIGLIDNVGAGIGRLVTCTESLGFESFDIENDDGDNKIIYNSNDHEGEDDCLKNKAGEEKEEKEKEMFPPPLSSLDGHGQPSFVLLPVRKNGRLQLSKVRVKRPEILCSTREGGRLRLYLVPDDEHNIDDDSEQEEFEEEEEEIEEETEEETEEIVEIISRYYEEEEEDRVREWEVPAEIAGGNEWFRRCYQVVHHIQCHQHVHSSNQHHLHMYGVGIA